MGITGCCNNRKIENFASTPLSARQQTSFSSRSGFERRGKSREAEKREIRRNPILGDFFLFEIGSGAYRAGPLGGEGVGEKNFLSGSKIVTAKWRAKTICRLAATNKRLAATNKRLAKRNRSRTGAKATKNRSRSG